MHAPSDVVVNPQDENQVRQRCCRIMACLIVALGFCVLMIFFLFASNVKEACEIDLTWHMKFYVLTLSCALGLSYLPLILKSGPTHKDLASCKPVFRAMAFVQQITMFAVCTRMNIAAVLWYNKTTDENCYGSDLDLDHYINPRKLLLAWIVVGFSSSCAAFICGLRHSASKGFHGVYGTLQFDSSSRRYYWG